MFTNDIAICADALCEAVLTLSTAECTSALNPDMTAGKLADYALSVVPVVLTLK